MLYQLIEKLDANFNFETVSALCKTENQRDKTHSIAEETGKFNKVENRIVTTLKQQK